jgi:ribosome-associated protein
MIKDDVIRLGQFLKLSGVVDSGAEVKELLAQGAILVNDEVEVRRGRQLFRGDRVVLGDETLVVAGTADGSPL